MYFISTRFFVLEDFDSKHRRNCASMEAFVASITSFFYFWIIIFPTLGILTDKSDVCCPGVEWSQALATVPRHVNSTRRINTYSQGGGWWPGTLACVSVCITTLVVMISGSDCLLLLLLLLLLLPPPLLVCTAMFCRNYIVDDILTPWARST